MPDNASGPKFTSGPPKSGRAPVARAKGLVPSSDEEEVVASTEPDDDLADYIVPPDPEPAADAAPGERVRVDMGDAAVTLAPSDAGQYTATTTADSELVRTLQEELARAQARLAGLQADPANWTVPAAPAKPQDGESVIIHVRKDGFTSNGRVWYQGQELEFTVGEQNWRDTLDRKGNSWLLLSESDQIRRYGEVMFGHGPWPGASWSNDRAAAAEQQRGRRAPTITQISSVPNK